MATCEDNPLDVEVDEKTIGVNITFHNLIILISALSTVVSSAISFYLIIRHAMNYTKPKAQKHIIRILFMVPVYTICCTLSIVFYRQNIYLGAVYEFYESLVLACFFLLLCNLLVENLDGLRRVFAVLEPQPWIWPLRVWQLLFRLGGKRGLPTQGLKWFHIIWVGVFQFCFVKFLGALAKCITEALHVYCEDVTGSNHAKIYIQIIEIISLTACMLFLIQFYKQVKVTLKDHRPLLKFLSIKIIVFLFYLQSFTVSHITSKGGPARSTPYVSYPSFAVGVPNTLLCIEMIAISIMHLFAYSWKPYAKNVHKRLGSDESLPFTSQEDYNPAGYPVWKAFADAANFLDVAVSFSNGCRWLVTTRKIRHEVVPLSRERVEGMDEREDPEWLEHWRTNDLGEALSVEGRIRSREQ